MTRPRSAGTIIPNGKSRAPRAGMSYALFAAGPGPVKLAAFGGRLRSDRLVTAGAKVTARRRPAPYR